MPITTQSQIDPTTSGEFATGPAGIQTVAIVGGGCSGILVAAHLMKVDRRPRRILIFEPGSGLGEGAAYATDHPLHLLNVPVRSMSAYEDQPDDFGLWLSNEDPTLGPGDFAPRRLYRRYLADVLRRASAAGASAGSTVTWVREAVTDASGTPPPGPGLLRGGTPS